MRNRPTASTLAELVAHPRCAKSSDRWPYAHVEADDLIAAGITRTDIDLFAATTTWGRESTRMTELLMTELSYLAVRNDTLDLADAVAWVIVAEQVGPSAYALADTWVRDAVRVRDAPTVPLGSSWRFAAAGISPAEATALIADCDGTLPVAELAAMAALRGVTVPVRALAEVLVAP